jgi:hypothetical protein
MKAAGCLILLLGLQGETTVGIPARIEELVLPGTELEAAPSDARGTVVLRILSVSPHGDEFRYDLEYTGFEPGTIDLGAHLRRKDGSSASDLPPIPVNVRSVLTADRVVPHAPGQGRAPRLGGYATALVVAGVVWILGLAAIVFVKRRRAESTAASERRPRTLAERLRPLVERAIDGRLSREERASLELSLLAYWRGRLRVEERSPVESLALLREHPEAGPLLRGLEDWLHRPAPRAEVDVASLLAPYRDLPPDALAVPD